MVKQYKAISLWQPWASLVALGAKKYETRSWSTKYRGLLMIHSAKRWTNEEKQYTNRFRHSFSSARLLPENPPLGCILAAVELVNVHRVEDVRHLLPEDERAFGNYADGRFAWELRLIKVAATPIAVKGMQGLWTWEYAA